MKKEVEKELKSFFLTVANYRFSENVEEYVKSIKSISKTPSLYDFARRIPDEFDSYLLLVKGIFSKDKDFDFFFEQQREEFIETLDQIVSGKPLLKIKELKQIVEKANILQPKKIFEFCNEDHVLSYNTGLYWDSVISLKAKTKNDRTIQILHKELEMVFSLACYSLALRIADGEGQKIKRCKQCLTFFVRTKNNERQLFCSDKCRYLFQGKKRKTTESKKDRAKYMKGYRSILRNRKRNDKIKRLMAGGDTLEEAEKFLK